MKVKGLVFSVVMAVCGNAIADWKHVENIMGSIDVYADMENIKVSGKTLKVWVLHDFKNAVSMETPQKMNLMVSSVSNQMEVQCDKDRSRAAYQIWYAKPMAKGNDGTVVDKPEPWMPIVPGGMIDKVVRAKCKEVLGLK